MLTEQELKDANEFIESKWLWWVNRILHTFGWVIVAHYTDIETPKGYQVNVFSHFSVRKNIPYRGFDEEVEELGYGKIAKWLEENIEEANKIFKETPKL